MNPVRYSRNLLHPVTNRHLDTESSSDNNFKLPNGVKKIIPVILTNDLKDLKNKLRRVRGLTDWVQIDIADGKFVNNVSVGLKDLLKVKTKFNFEAHLMVLDPEKYLADCRRVGIKRVLFHFEATNQPLTVLDKIKKFGFEAGIALNPETPIYKIKPYLNKIGVILILGVHPGFSGQTFIPSTLDKIRQLKKLSRQVKIEVDGGINLNNAQKIVRAGADYLVVSSALFKSENIKQTFKQLQAEIR